MYTKFGLVRIVVILRAKTIHLQYVLNCLVETTTEIYWNLSAYSHENWSSHSAQLLGNAHQPIPVLISNDFNLPVFPEVQEFLQPELMFA